MYFKEIIPGIWNFFNYENQQLRVRSLGSKEVQQWTAVSLILEFISTA